MQSYMWSYILLYMVNWAWECLSLINEQCPVINFLQMTFTFSCQSILARNWTHVGAGAISKGDTHSVIFSWQAMYATWMYREQWPWLVKWLQNYYTISILRLRWSSFCHKLLNNFMTSMQTNLKLTLRNMTYVSLYLHICIS